MSGIKISILFTLIFLVCGICTVGWPGNWDRSAPGDENGPIRQSLWAFHHARQAVFQNESFFHTCLVNPPECTRLSGVVPAVYPALFAPVTSAFGVSVAVNLAAWIGVFLTCVFGFLFFYEISGDALAGILAGFIYGCGFYSLNTVGGGDVASGPAFLLPLACFFFVRVLDQGGAVYGLLAVVSLAGALWFNVTYGFAVLVFAAFASGRAFFDDGLGAFLRGMTVCALGVILLVVRTITLGPLDFSFSIDLLAPIYFAGPGGYLFPLLAFAGGIFGAFFARDKRLFWWILGIVYFCLALGPNITIMGQPTGVGILPKTPFFSVLEPARFVAGMSLALCALFAAGLRSVLDRFEKKDRDESLVSRGLFLALCIFLIWSAPGNTVSTEIPAPYKMVSPPGTILELPITNDPNVNAHFLFAQSAHGASVICGAPFTGQNAALLFGKLPKDNSIYRLAADSQDAAGIAISKKDLVAFGITFVAFHPGYLIGESGMKLKNALVLTLGEPISQGEDVEIYRVTADAS